MLESSAHGILAADGRKAESDLHFQGTEEGAHRLAPDLRIVGHSLEIFLTGESHFLVASACSDDLGTSLDHRICGTVIRAPLGNHRVESECHHAGSIGVAVGRELLHGNLRLGQLEFSTIRHEHGRTSDRRVEHLYQSLLAHHVGIAEIVQELLFQCLSFDLSAEWIFLFDSGDFGFRKMLRTGTVNEFSLKVCHDLVTVEHPHALGIGNVGDMGHFNVLAVAIFHELRLILGLDHHRHSLL